MSVTLNDGKFHLLVGGWTHEYFPEWDCSVFSAPNQAGHVTVDYNARAYRTGMTFRGRNDSELEYRGHAWRKRLELDAQLYLAELLGA
jgi:hypothetical protein